MMHTQNPKTSTRAALSSSYKIPSETSSINATLSTNCSNTNHRFRCSVFLLQRLSLAHLLRRHQNASSFITCQAIHRRYSKLQWFTSVPDMDQETIQMHLHGMHVSKSSVPTQSSAQQFSHSSQVQRRSSKSSQHRHHPLTYQFSPAL